MPVRGVVLAEHVHRAEDLDAGIRQRHEDLRLAAVRRSVGVRLDHDDHDLAARVAGAGDVVLLAVDQPLVAVEHGPAGDVLGVRRGDVRLGHRVGRTDLTGEQRLEPALLLLRRADTLEHLHVPGVRRTAVEALRRQRVLPQLLGDVRVVEVGEALAGLGVGQEEVPQSVGLGLRLHAVEQFELTLAVAPVVGASLAEPVVLGGDRLDLVGDERLHRLVERYRVLRHRQVEGVVGGDARVHSWCGHGASLTHPERCRASTRRTFTVRARTVPHRSARRLGRRPGRGCVRGEHAGPHARRRGLHPLLLRRASWWQRPPGSTATWTRSWCCASTPTG